MSSALVIADGSLAALVAAAIERDRGVDVIAWVPPQGSGLSAPGFACAEAASLVRQQAALLGFERIIEHAEADLPATASPIAEGVRATMLLLDAARAAMEAGCGRIIWPLAVDDDLSAMARADERAELVNRVLLLDEEAGQGRAPEIVLPVVDLSAGQIDDLAGDLGVPRHLCGASGVPAANPK